MRFALYPILLAATTFGAPRKPVLAFLPPAGPDEDLRGLGLLLEARASELIEQSGRFSELHLKQVFSMAEAEGLAVDALSVEPNAKQARLFLGADRLVTLSLAQSGQTITLTGALIDAKKSTPFSAKLPGSWAEALRVGSELIARKALATEKTSLTPGAKAQPDSKSSEALRSLSQCYATVIRQPLGVENPVVLNASDLAAAAIQCEKALAADGALRFAHAVLAFSYAIAGDAKRATKALNALTSTDDVIEPYTLARFWMVTRFQSNEDGISSLKEVLQRHPTELIALNYLGDTHSVLNDHGAAQAIWAEYLRLVPDSPYAHGRLSKALARQNKHAEAIASAKKALELAPTSRAARLELGSRFIDANQLDDAVATLAQIPEPKGEAVLRLGWAHWLKGDIDTAAIHFRKSLETATAPSEWRTRGRAHYNLALVESARGRLGAAKVEFKASLLTGYRVRTVDPLLEATATDVERSGFAQPASPDAGTRMKLAPTESSLVPFDPTGEALPNLKKDPPPEGFILYKF